jgi:hypothetical protein
MGRTFGTGGKREARRRGACRALASLVGLTGVFLPFAGSAHAHPARMGIDVDQGVYASEVGAPYAFTGRFGTGYQFEKLQLGMFVAAAFMNPKWEPGAGASVSFVAFPLLESYTGVRVAFEGTYLPRHEWRATGGLVLDLDGFRGGVSGGYDSFHRSALVLTTFGFDLPQVTDLLAATF